MTTIPPHRSPGDVGHVADHDNISDVLTDHQTRIITVEGTVSALSSGGVTSVNGAVGIVTLVAADVGAIALAARGAVNGVASLDGTGKVPTAQLPAAVGGGAVSSVNGQTGAVVLGAADVGALALAGGSLSGPLTVSAAVSAVAASSVAAGLNVSVIGDSQQRLAVNGSGRLLWGTGSITGDTNLYRSTATELTTDGAFVAGVSAQTPTLQGGQTASGSLTLKSTSHVTRGKILFGTSGYDESTNRLGIGTNAPTVPLDVVGQISATTAAQAPTMQGSSIASGNLTLRSTSNATKGKVFLGISAYDEATNRLGIGTSTPAVSLDVVGQVTATGIVQTPSVQGSAVASGSLILSSTGHGTKGKIFLGISVYDEVNDRLGIGNSAPTLPLDVTGDTRTSGTINVGTYVVRDTSVWHAITSLGTSWAAGPTAGTVQPLQYRRDAEDNVVINGALHSTGASPAATAFVMPASFRPAVTQRVVAVQNASGTVTAKSVEFNSNGNVVISPLPTATGQDVYLNVIIPLGNIT